MFFEGGSWHNRMQVAFSAYIASSRSLPTNKKLIIDKTRTNIGNAYSTSNGIFTAPVDGMYAFHWTMTVLKGYHSIIRLQVNGSNKADMYAFARNYPNHYSPSQSYVTELKKGDQVNLYNSGSSGYVYGSYSTFTGYRL
ncbi:hypothetical protein FSP39_021580 [Pinctada imbricata]|uniref:C1q domain-containing protein n=1 Tax=Pinctada imbricata TaxID=66713 RepID=A0AA88YCB8_PINIB|nr:hypothetical protein FSP39_021580 [Pinctada imbricata]